MHIWETVLEVNADEKDSQKGEEVLEGNIINLPFFLVGIKPFPFIEIHRPCKYLDIELKCVIKLFAEF